MRQYEAHIQPPETAPSLLEPAHIDMTAALGVADAIQRWAERHTGTQGDHALLTDEETGRLLTDIAVGQAVQKIVDSFDDTTPEIFRFVTQADLDQQGRARERLEIQAILLGSKVGAAVLGHPQTFPGSPKLADDYPLLSSIAVMDARHGMHIEYGIDGALAALNRELATAALPSTAIFDAEIGERCNRGLFAGAYSAIQNAEMVRQSEDNIEVPPEWVSWQDVTFLPASSPPLDIADLGDKEYREDNAASLTISDIYPDLKASDAFARLEQKLSPGDMFGLLAKLKDHQRLVVLGRSGLGVSELGFSGPDPQPYQTLAEMIDVNPGRISGIYTEALNNLRKPEYARPILALLSHIDADTAMDQLVVDDCVRTARVLGRKSDTPPVAGALESELHTTDDQQWWDSLKNMDTIMNRTGSFERIQRGSIAYAKAYYALLDGIDALSDGLRAVHAEVLTSPYPEVVYKELVEHIGRYITPPLLEDIWNFEAGQILRRVYRRSGDRRRVHPDRFGQLFSRLLLDCMQEDDLVHIRIPPNFAWQCGYLGAWARRGKLIITGHTGTYTGLHMSGSAHIVVHGKAGAHEGHNSGGDSSLAFLKYDKIYAAHQESMRVPVMSREELEQAERQLLSMGTATAAETIASLQAPQVLAFDLAAEYLGLTQHELSNYNRRMGRALKEGFTAEKISELLRRYPKLKKQLGLE